MRQTTSEPPVGAQGCRAPMAPTPKRRVATTAATPARHYRQTLNAPKTAHDKQKHGYANEGEKQACACQSWALAWPQRGTAHPQARWRVLHMLSCACTGGLAMTPALPLTRLGAYSHCKARGLPSQRRVSCRHRPSPESNSATPAQHRLSDTPETRRALGAAFFVVPATAGATRKRCCGRARCCDAGGLRDKPHANAEEWTRRRLEGSEARVRHVSVAGLWGL